MFSRRTHEYRHTKNLLVIMMSLPYNYICIYMLRFKGMVPIQEHAFVMA